MSSIYTKTDQGAVTDTLTIPVDPSYPHVFVAVKYYTDDTYTTIAVPLAGTIDVGVRVNGNNGYSVASNSPIDCTDDSYYCEAGACIDSVRSIPNGISVATHYQITVTASAT